MSTERSAAELTGQVDAMMRVARVLVGVIARSLSPADGALSAAQLRVLALVAQGQMVTLSDVSHALQVHPSNATRTCNSLVEAGWLSRQESAGDRRQRVLALTAQGRRLVGRITRARRRAVQDLLRDVPARDRRGVETIMNSIADAAGEADVRSALLLGWVE